MSSKVRVAGVVCEGPTDFPILKQVICRTWPDVRRVLSIQPELDEVDATPRDRRGGWSEVRAWCQRNQAQLDFLLSEAAGEKLDLLVIATDLDIAVQAGVRDPPAHLDAYASARFCDTVKDWLRPDGRRRLPAPVVIGLPAMAIEAWIIAVLFSEEKAPEAIPDPADFLAQHGQLQRKTQGREQGKPWKNPALYHARFAPAVGSHIGRVRSLCPEAERLCHKIESRQQSVEKGG